MPVQQREIWKTSEKVAFRLAHDIVAGGLVEGDHLPREAELVDHYGVSRESIREALRLLEAQGMVSIRRGPGGGPIVGRAESANLARTMTLYFHLSGSTYDELLHAWFDLEPGVAARAAANPDRGEVARLMAPHLTHFEDGGDRACYMEHSNGLHFAMAALDPEPGAAHARGVRRRHHPHARDPGDRPVRHPRAHRRRPPRHRRGGARRRRRGGTPTRCATTSNSSTRSTGPTGTAACSTSSPGSEFVDEFSLTARGWPSRAVGRAGEGADTWLTTCWSRTNGGRVARSSVSTRPPTVRSASGRTTSTACARKRRSTGTSTTGAGCSPAPSTSARCSRTRSCSPTTRSAPVTRIPPTSGSRRTSTHPSTSSTARSSTTRSGRRLSGGPRPRPAATARWRSTRSTNGARATTSPRSAGSTPPESSWS